MGTPSGCVVRFFEHNDRIKKHLFHRIVLPGRSLEHALSVAYHTLKDSPQKVGSLVSVEVEVTFAAVAETVEA